MATAQAWWRWLFDFSAGEKENTRIAQSLTGLLEVALAESETDAGFEQCFRLLVKAADGLTEEHIWSWLTRRLSDYRRAGEFSAMPRTLASRFLRDIPRRYGLDKTP